MLIRGVGLHKILCPLCLLVNIYQIIMAIIRSPSRPSFFLLGSVVWLMDKVAKSSVFKPVFTFKILSLFQSSVFRKASLETARKPYYLLG